MNIHHGGAGHTGEDRDLDCHIEDTVCLDIGPNNDIESTNRSDTMIAFGGSEADSHLSNHLPNNQET